MTLTMKGLSYAPWLALLWLFIGQPWVLASKHHHHDVMNQVDDSAGQKVDVHGPLWQFQHQLKAAFDTPLQSQKAFLAIMGAGLTAGGKMKCNIFGGPGACSDVDQLRETCSGMNHNIDCALLSAASNAGSDPKAAMHDMVEAQGLEQCDECSEALHAIWCGQSAPTCGTFDKMVDELLPALQKVALGEKRPGPALSEVVPKVLQAASLGLPCREMCEAVTASCGCGKPTTFGKMMTMLHKKAPSVGQKYGLYSTNMSEATAREIFAGIWDHPVCDLFAPSTLPGFAGTCTKKTASDQSSACKWCNKNGRPDFVDEQIVAQISHTISGMMQAGLERLLDASDPLRRGSRTVEPGFDWSESSSPTVNPEEHGKGHAWAYVLGGGLVATLMMGAIVYVRVKQEQLKSVPYAHLDMDTGMDGIRYNPPVL